MRLSNALPLFVAGTTAADWLASVGLTGSNAGADFGLRRYWLPSSDPAVPRWATEAEWFAQYTAPAGRSYEYGGSIRNDLAANLPRFVYSGGRRRLLIEGGLQNKIAAPKVNPTGTTGWTTNGYATLSVVNDASALAAAGLSAVCTNGSVYKIDNSSGASADYVQLPGTSGDTNGNILDAYVRVISGSGATMSFSSSGAASVNLPAAGGDYTRVTSFGTPTATTQRMQFFVPAGVAVHIIIPGMYVRSASFPLYYPVVGDTAASIYLGSESFRFPVQVETMMGGASRSALVRGTLFGGPPVTSCIVSFGAGTENDRWQMYIASSPLRSFFALSAGGVAIPNIQTGGGSFQAYEPFGSAAAIEAGNYALDDSKGTIATSTAAGTLPAVTRGYLGRRQDGGATAHGLYDLVAFWPTRVTNATLQALAVAA